MYSDELPTRSSTQSSSRTWERYEEKLFEKALIQFSEDLPDRWLRIAGSLGKSVEEVTEYYQDLVHDVDQIESGRVELPCYRDEESFCHWSGCGEVSFGGKANKQSEVERKKGTPWNEEEHRLFLIGLNKYGKGDWRSISRNVVITRTPTQVASHAQKFFLRQMGMSMKKERKRSSIHDITSVDENSVVPPTDQSLDPQSGASVQQSYIMPDMSQFP